MTGYFEREASYASVRLTAKNYRGGPPLSIVNGKSIRQRNDDSSDHGPSITTDETPQIMSRSNSGQKDDVGIFDEPLSSSDESDDQPAARGSDQDEEEHEETRQKDAAEDIKPTRFQSQSQSQPYSPSQSSHTPKSTDPDLEETFGAFSQQRKRRNNYAKSGNIHGSSNAFSSQEKARNGRATGYNDNNNSSNNRTKKRKLDETKADNSKGFRLPKDREILSPVKAPRKEKDDVEDANPQPAFRMPASLDGDGMLERISTDPTKLFKEPRSQPSASTISSSLASKDAIFDEAHPVSSPLSEISLSAFPDEISPLKTKEEPDGAPAESLCPNCNAPVDADLLDEFLALPNRRLRDERRFCERHKHRKAEKEWTEKGYPVIDWESFESRIQHHFPTLDKQLVPQSTSFFRGRLESAMKSGQAKNFRLTLEGDNLENMSCGYYGPKGASRMLTAVTSNFSRRLRQLASMDNILKTAGPAAYAQAVLVPELAVLLIKQDMNVDSQEARQILRDSMDIGNRLNAAENDAIRVDQDEDDEAEAAVL
ncbi:hypothetical protein PISL3812_07292 [Talaromyces islandicus]|uniref:Restriction of telomere capping protein 4 n=1 Tax=Talaromyces islandicus TaxID=28573 RepID=A0A0U1M3U5_TALIS|nr:hypothetical protein PISL3812_07292 [Talaromyces islandicus]